MKFSYQKYPANPNLAFPDRKRALRPVIPIGLIGKDGNIYRYEVLIDSGADHNIFHAEMGELMGLKVKEGKPLEFWGVTGEK